MSHKEYFARILNPRTKPYQTPLDRYFDSVHGIVEPYLAPSDDYFDFLGIAEGLGTVVSDLTAALLPDMRAWTDRLNRSQPFVIGGYQQFGIYAEVLVGFYDKAQLFFTAKVLQRRGPARSG